MEVTFTREGAADPETGNRGEDVVHVMQVKI